MLRFTIRDVFWLTVVIAILSLWAMERRFVNNDWAKIHMRDGQLYSKIEKQAEGMRTQAKANQQLYFKLQDERQQLAKVQRELDELKAEGDHRLIETDAAVP